MRTGFIQGFGLGFIFVPLSTVTFATLPPELRTEATGLFSLMRNIGSSIGISVVMSLLAQQHADQPRRDRRPRSRRSTPLLYAPGDPPVLERLDGGRQSALNDVVTTAGADHRLRRRLRLMMFLTLAALPMLLLMRKGAGGGGGAHAAVAD